MQYIILSSLLATASALSAKELMAASLSDPTAKIAKIVNRCSYDVNLWSVDKQIGCTKDAGLVLKKGQSYQEILQPGTNGGISIKLSKFDTCGGHDLTQLEYKLETGSYGGNYLDMSFVDCAGGDCPGWHDGFYLKSGNDGNVNTASATNNEHCPIFSVANAVEAAAVSYVNPDDRQTKWCLADANLELYLCGSQAPSDSDSNASSASAAPSSTFSAAPSSTFSAAPSSSKPVSTSQAKPTTTQAASKPSSSDVEIKAAAITSAPAPAAEPTRAVKTVVEYVTAFVDAPVKRHAHGRRHQHFKA